MTPDEIDAALADLPGWTRDQDQWLRRDFTFADFDEAMAFIEAIANVARRLDHHPNLTNVYNRVGLALQTHDAGGITARDIAFIRGVQEVERA